MRSSALCSIVAVGAIVALITGARMSYGESEQADAAAVDAAANDEAETTPEDKEKIVKPATEWRKQLTKMQYYVTRQAGTERAFSGKYWKHKGKGTYLCVCCGEPLFSSTTKFKSGTGWPSFYAPIAKRQVEERIDRGLFSVRTEVVCSRCDAHLGHVFPDGPEPTGLRYCMNSAALTFKPEPKKTAAVNDGE